jgi:Fe-S-cluster-containing hydrogenase component 2
MSLYITDECINCDVCEPVCPNEAIYMGVIYKLTLHFVQSALGIMISHSVSYFVQLIVFRLILSMSSHKMS